MGEAAWRSNRHLAQHVANDSLFWADGSSDQYQYNSRAMYGSLDSTSTRFVATWDISVFPKTDRPEYVTIQNTLEYNAGKQNTRLRAAHHQQTRQVPTNLTGLFTRQRARPRSRQIH